MEQKPKISKSLFGTITQGLVGGVLLGYLAGSGLEDVLSYLPTHYSPENLKLISSAIGVAGFSLLSLLQFYNKDPHEKALVLYTKEREEPEQTPIKAKPNLEGITLAVEKLTKGIHNKPLAENLYSEITERLENNPFKNMREKYESNKNGYFANTFAIFVPFNYNGREINPRETLEEFFDKGEEIYKTMIEKISTSLGNYVVKENASIKELPENFRETLSRESKLSEDISLWLTYLSKRSGVVGLKVREKLNELGIKNPDYLAKDINRIGQNILELYDSKTKSKGLIKNNEI